MKFLKRILSGALAFCCAASLLPTVAFAQEPKAEPKTGTFTAVSMNVDGLPLKILGIDINKGGPGEAGTRAIGRKMAEYDWDIIGVSEDFNYNDELVEGLTDKYNFGTYRGGVSWFTNNTDGLNLMWKKSLSATGESWTSWNEHYSTGFANTGNGADGMIDKGYRYYEVQVAEGVYVDVYILHMDADSDQGDIDARHSQLTQLAQAIRNSDNKNPIIVMGDTNCRYTREDIRAWFMEPINADERFEIKDAWIEDARGGQYPKVGDNALMAVDKGGTIEYPQAEIVDKIFYINNTDSNIQLSLDRYDVVTDFTNADGTALADHWPIVGTFKYTEKPQEGTHVHNYIETSKVEPTCTQEGSTTWKCEGCGESYTDPIPALGHDYQITQQTDASCTEKGAIVYTCIRCNDSYTEEIPAKGHNYEDGVCTVCGAKDPSVVENVTFGSAANAVENGKKYAIVTSSTTKNFALTHKEDGAISSVQTDIAEGTVADNNMAWTIEPSESGYTISTEINGMKKYLVCTYTSNGYGYKVDLEDDPFVWTVRYQSSSNGFRVLTKRHFKNYALRYYNSRAGWVATTKAMDIHFYELNE